MAQARSAGTAIVAASARREHTYPRRARSDRASPDLTDSRSDIPSIRQINAPIGHKTARGRQVGGYRRLFQAIESDARSDLGRACSQYAAAAAMMLTAQFAGWPADLTARRAVG